MKPQNQINILLLGCGSMGKNHFRLLKEIDSFRLVGVVEPDLELRHTRLCDFQEVFSDLDEVESSSFDAVVIATPIPTHFELTKKLLQLGKHVLIEKPLSSTPEHCKELLDIAQDLHKVLAVGHSERYNPAFTAFVEQLKSRDLGKLFRWEFHRIGPYPMNPGEFGVVGDLAVHDFDLFYQLTHTRPEWIFSQTTRQFHPSHEDGLTLLAGFEFLGRDCLALFNVNWLSPRKQRFIRVYGEHGMLEANLFERQLKFYESKLRRNKADEFGIHGIEYGATEDIEVLDVEPLKAELLHFAERIKNEDFKVDSEEGSKFAVEFAIEAVEAQGHKVLKGFL